MFMSLGYTFPSALLSVLYINKPLKWDVILIFLHLHPFKNELDSRKRFVFLNPADTHFYVVYV